MNPETYITVIFKRMIGNSPFPIVIKIIDAS